MSRLLRSFMVIGAITFLSGLGAMVGPTALSAAVQGISLPDDLEFEVIKETTSQGQRRSLDVRLSQKVRTEVLEALAIRLRDQAQQSFARTFIVYYLPGMEVDAGGWAISHFNPSLEVKVLGTPVGSGPSLEDSEKVLGVWENNQPGFASVYVILETPTGFQMEQTFPDGSSSRTELVEQATPVGRRFKDPKNRFGEVWLVRNGVLELHDQEGMVFRARPVR